jgi:hypothetical protein
MTNEPKLAPEAPAKDDANQSGKDGQVKPAVMPAPATTPPIDAKKI